MYKPGPMYEVRVASFVRRKQLSKFENVIPGQGSDILLYGLRLVKVI